MKSLSFVFLTLIFSIISLNAQKTTPIFKDGQAQIVPAFEDETKWLRHRSRASRSYQNW